MGVSGKRYATPTGFADWLPRIPLKWDFAPGFSLPAPKLNYFFVNFFSHRTAQMDGQASYDTNSISTFISLDNKSGNRSQMNERTNCETCLLIKQSMFANCGNAWTDQKGWKTAMDLFIRHDPETHITAPAKTTHTGNGTHQGWFAGTLTMSPDDGKTEDDMVIAIEKIMKQQTCPVDKYAWYVEYTKAGLAHIHFIYITPGGTRIHKKVFQRYWMWEEPRNNVKGAGFRGGYHKPVDSLVAYKEYISKDSGKHGGNISLEEV